MSNQSKKRKSVESECGTVETTTVFLNSGTPKNTVASTFMIRRWVLFCLFICKSWPQKLYWLGQVSSVLPFCDKYGLYYDGEFRNLCDSTANDESMALSKIMPFIAGCDNAAYLSKAGIPFNNLKSFDTGLSEPKPDMYDGAPASAVHSRVRAVLAKYITPSTVTRRPSCPFSSWMGKSCQITYLT